MIVRKRRTREHVIADLAVNYVERQVLLCGYTAERIAFDYGYDLFLFTFDPSGQPEHGEIRVQAKATDKVTKGDYGSRLTVRVSRAHVAHWVCDKWPVVLVLYDAQNDAAYWVDVKHYFNELRGFNIFAAGQTITVNIPRQNVFDVSAVEQLAAAKNQLMRENG